MSKAFGSKNLEKCIVKLGFRYTRASSSHWVYNPPKGVNNPQNRPFVFKVNVKSYDLHSRARYISELKSYGFTKSQIEKFL